MARNVDLVECAPQPTAVVAVVSSWDEFPSLWAPLLTEVWEAVRAAGARAGRNVMLYRDERPDVEVGVELLGPFKPTGRVITSALPAGPTATTIEPGPPTPNGIAAAHRRVKHWCQENGYELSSVCWEIYSHQSDDPTQMYVQIHHALA